MMIPIYISIPNELEKYFKITSARMRNIILWGIEQRPPIKPETSRGHGGKKKIVFISEMTYQDITNLCWNYECSRNALIESFIDAFIQKQIDFSVSKNKDWRMKHDSITN